MSSTRILLSVCLFALAGSTLSSAQEEDLHRVLDLYRKVVVVLDVAEETGDPALERIAWTIYAQKQSHVESLSERLDPSALADYLSGAELSAGDLLAFTDLVDAMSDAPQRAAPSSLDDVRQRIDDHRAGFDEEVSTSRGAPERPRWTAYVRTLRDTIPLESIQREFPLEPVPGTRAAYGEHAVFGYGLPDKHLVLSFDDGPHPRYTQKILRTLEEYGATAYFFSVGRNLGTVDDGADPSLRWTKASVHAKLAHEAGHILANHSYSHRQMPKLSEEERLQEIGETNRLLEAITSKPPSLFRPPYGDTNRSLTDEYAGFGMTSVLWNVDSWDWGDPVPESIVQRVVERVDKAGRGVLLFHDVHKQTVAALPSLLRELRARGYRFSTLEGEATKPPKRLTGLEPPRASSTTARATTAPIPYRESFALVVGINAYETWPRLSYAVSDAIAVRDSLIERFAFKPQNVTTLVDEDATRENIVSILGETLANPSLVKRDDRVFVFFAGHGATRKLPSGKDLGYIVPVDADLRHYPTRSISMSQLAEFSELIPAKHVYFVMDSCYSGIALSRSAGTSDPYLDEVTRRGARQISDRGRRRPNRFGRWPGRAFHLYVDASPRAVGPRGSRRQRPSDSDRARRVHGSHRLEVLGSDSELRQPRRERRRRVRLRARARASLVREPAAR